MKSLFSFSIICFFLLMSFGVQSKTENPYLSKLWLPVAYKKHFTRLLDAAKKIDGYDQCHQLVDGSLLESRSSMNHPIFLFRCRDYQRKMQLFYVDSKNLQITRQERLWNKSDEDKRQRQLRKQLRQLLANRDKYWQICNDQLIQIWKNFNRPALVGRIPPRPEITSDTQLIYEFEFTTLSPTNAKLSYKATAVIGDSEVCKLDIVSKPHH